MIMNLLIVALVLAIAYAWMIRGAFSSMIQLLCVIGAGAIAFAFWEKLAYLLVDLSPVRGFFSFLESIAWGVSLVVPFVVALVLLRLLCDKLVPNNIKNATVVDYLFGGIFGLGTGVLCAGVLLIGIGSLRLSTQFLGYQPLWYSTDRARGDGVLVRSDRLWIPADALTSRVFGMLSKGTMSTAEPLAKWYPELELVGFSTRVSPGDGSGRNAMRPDDFKVVSRYIVGNPNGSDSISDLLKDSSDNKPQKYLDINSEPISKGYIAGYVIEFEPGAKERGKKGGQLVVSNGQFRLLAGDSSGHTVSIFPIATISESAKAGEFGRWRFDAPDIFITSVGGKSRMPMGFEFVVPQGYSPIALFVKNVRVKTDSLPDPVEYAGVPQRDQIVRSGSILKGETSGRKLDTSTMVRIDPTGDQRLIRKSDSISEMMGTQVARRGFTLDDDNLIVDGEGVFNIASEVGRKNAPRGKKLRVSKYALTKGQLLLSVDVGASSEIGFLSDAAGNAPLDKPLVLIDEQGNEYEAIGFEYTDSKVFHARYTRGSTLSGIQDTPSLSRNDPSRKLSLLFVVSDGVKITHFAIGDTAIAQFVPPFDTKAR